MRIHQITAVRTDVTNRKSQPSPRTKPGLAGDAEVGGCWIASIGKGVAWPICAIFMGVAVDVAVGDGSSRATASALGVLTRLVSASAPVATAGFVTIVGTGVLSWFAGSTVSVTVGILSLAGVMSGDCATASSCTTPAACTGFSLGVGALNISTVGVGVGLAVGKGVAEDVAVGVQVGVCGCGTGVGGTGVWVGAATVVGVFVEKGVLVGV